MSWVALNLKHPLLVLLIVVSALAFVVRMPGLGEFMTADEENWMLRSAEFWHDLFREGDISGTYITTHPGATTMWISGSGIFIKEARLGYDIEAANLHEFRRAALLPLVVTISILIGIITVLIAHLFDNSVAWIAGFLLSVEPYFIGMSQIVHLDMILALTMLAAALAYLIFLKNNKHVFLILTGLASGTALATKLLPSLWLFVFFAVIMVFNSKFRWQKIARDLRSLFGIALIAFVALVLLWPGIATSLDFQSGALLHDATMVVTQEHSSLEDSTDPVSPGTFYLKTVLGRLSPLVQVLSVASLLLALFFAYHARMRGRDSNNAPTIVHLSLYAVGFIVLITSVAKKGDRYALPALIVSLVLVAWALAWLWRFFNNRYNGRVAAFLVMVGLLFLAQAYFWIPYTVAYENPYFHDRPFPQQGWGEGLDQAAQYLNQSPIASKLVVASWYPGVLGTYFNGTTLSLSSRTDDRVGYVVLYRNMLGRGVNDQATTVLGEFKEKTPAHVVYIAGKPYVWIYDTLGIPYFPEHVGEITGEVEVGQTIPSAPENWRGISVGLATFSSRNNTHDVTLHVREDINATSDIRTVTVNATEIADSTYHDFIFDPITVSKDKTYYIFLTSLTSVPGNAITARYSEEDLAPGSMVLKRRALRSSETNEQFLRHGDLAYRLIGDAN